jgi:hypothetical protein
MAIGYAQGYVYDSTEIKTLEVHLGTSKGMIPKKISLRPFTDTPQNQGTLPFCVSWAIMEAWAIQKGAAQKKIISFSADFLIHYLHRTTYDQPISIHQGLKLLKQKGVLPNYENYREAPTPQDTQKALTHRIIGFGAFFDNRFRHQTAEEEKKLVQNIKLLISQNQPVIVGLEVNETFKKGELEIWQGCQSSDKTFQHAVCIIGYNDEQKYFEIVNSWGTKWADNGFCRISYDAMIKNALQAFFIKKKEDNH